MRFLIAFVLLSLAAITPTPTAMATLSASCTLYASPSVANGSGKSGLTIANAVSLVDAAAKTTPGSVVCLLGGTYLLANSFAPTKSGTASAWIIYRPYNPGGATLKWNSTASQPMVYLLTTNTRDLRYIEFNGLTFDGNSIGSNAIFCQTPSSVTNNTNPDHFRFVNNIIRNVGAAGIATIKCDYITSIGNRLHNIGMLTGWGSGISYNTNVWSDNAASFHNLIIDNIISGVYDCCGTNRIDDPGNDTDITDGNGIIIDRSAIGDRSPPTLIANNVVYQNGGRCIITFHAGNTWILNNTCYKNGLDPLIGNDGSTLFEIGDIQIGGYSANNYVANNIAYTFTPRNSYQLMTVSDALFSYDLWYGGQGLYGFTGGVANGDPLFTNPPAGEQYSDALDPAQLTDNFHLQQGSPAIDAGIDPRTISGQKVILKGGTIVTSIPAITQAMTTYLLTDIDGAPRTNWDLGAYKWAMEAN